MLKLWLILLTEENSYVIDIEKKKKRLIYIQIIDAEDKMKSQLFKNIDEVNISQ